LPISLNNPLVGCQLSRRSPDERSDIRGDLDASPAYRCAHADFAYSDICPDVVSLSQGILAFWAPMGFKPGDFITIGTEREAE
jgi:hypothetical protein